MTETPTKPRRGRPKAGTDDAVAVAFMEGEVVRLAKEGKSFYAIDGMLGVTNSDRIFRRAVEKGRTRTREDAYAIESMRLDELAERAWQALDESALDGLAGRIAEILAEQHDIGSGDDENEIPRRVRDVLTQAYSDTYRGIPVALKVHEQRAKLDGLTHGDRVADAQLQLDAAKIQLWGTWLAEALDVLGIEQADKVRVVRRWGELSEGA